MIFDSHCHPQFPQYDKDREDVLNRAKDAGVFMICVGTDLETSKRGIELAQKHNNIWATIGLHPNDVQGGLPEARLLETSRSLASGEKIVAIGEVGLDYYRTPEPEKQKKQKEVFEQFVDLAIKNDKPIIIHARDAAKGSAGKVHKDILDIFGNWKFLVEGSRAKPGIAVEIGNSTLCAVAHSFTGNIDDARKYLNLGFYLGFNGILTFTRQYDEVVKYVPLENILLETDAPFLAPEPYRSTRNEPAYVVEVAKKVSELKGEPFEKVIEQTTVSCKNLFKLV